ncbi:MAG TPA: diiron oxygenase [Rhizobacter sp.]|nr:diiron oxygenase [Rhizobacter sp.]
METASELATRLTKASRKKLWDVYNTFNWPEALEQNVWYMPPELISIYGTPAYEALTEEQQKKLSLYELGNFFSLVLQGERPLVAGLVDRLYAKGNSTSVNEYLHHFVDEENKHMVMFGEFCNRYIGKVYPEKKITLAKTYAKGEEEVAFYCKVMVVEELGDYFNVTIEKDERVDALVREINKVHHIDEARHLAFGRVQLAELFARYSPDWSPETLAGFREWLVAYLRASWGDYYNPTMYRDAGLADAYDLRQLAMSHPVCAEARRKASAKVVNYFIKTGLLAEEPSL